MNVAAFFLGETIGVGLMSVNPAAAKSFAVQPVGIQESSL